MSLDLASIIVDDYRTLRKHIVCIDRTPCGWGGSRPWFICPECGRRCTVLAFSGRVLACRVCRRIPYASQSESFRARVLRRQDKLYERAPNGIRPKWMRHRTWAKLDRKFEAIERASDVVMADFAARLERIKGRKRQRT